MERTAHVATVHWRSDSWIDTQLEALKRHCPCPMRLYAYLSGVDEAFYVHFDSVHTEDNLSHPLKLNALADEICALANDDDILIFIDGDAFPVADLGAAVDALERYPLVAAQRLENNGDLQPHPCFCCTTVGFWREIAGDWRGGGYWKNSQGQPVTDVGGRLLVSLQERGVEWLALTRSNKHDLHPLWFGVYGDVVYHHGAGFRDKLCRLDALRGVDLFSRLILKLQARLRLGRIWPGLDRAITKRIHNYMRFRNGRMADRVFASIQADPDFAQHWGFLEQGSPGQ
ncbi:MAG: hypothetical protein ABJ308_10445 [Halieaceae bacterium]